jgi:hypothetical protein
MACRIIEAMGIKTIVTTVATVVVAIGLDGCASAPIEGAREPPPDWKAVTATDCGALAGVYSDFGAPAPRNSTSYLYTLVWPNAGSLVSFIERGVNSPPRFDFLTVSVRIDVPAGGAPAFSAHSSPGADLPLTPREWWCDGGTLVTRASLGTTAASYSEKEHDESYVRLWKAEDGALVAENTFRSVRQRLRATATHEPFARFYFRFPPASPPGAR